MLTFALLVVIVALCAFGYLVSLNETAYTYIPRSELSDLGFPDKEEENNAITIYALRFYKVLVELTSAVATYSLLDMFIRHALGTSLVTVLLLALVFLLFFEIFPRRNGRRAPAKYVKRYQRFVVGLVRIFALFPYAKAVNKYQENNVDRPRVGVYSEEEIREFVDRATDNEYLEDDEAEMVQSVLDMDDTLVRSVMVPRADMVSIDIEESLDDALSLFLRSGFSRVPVLEEGFDDIRGFLYFKDLIAATSGDQQSVDIASISRPARFVPDSKRVMDLLKEMQRESTHVAVVVDEYGGTAGLVTLEDLIEEVVGEISDEYDQEKYEVKMQDDGTFKISSRLSLWELGDIFGIELEDEDVDTVWGLMAKELGKVPIVGSEILVSGIHIKALSTSGRRNRVGTLLVWAENQG